MKTKTKLTLATILLITILAITLSLRETTEKHSYKIREKTESREGADIEITYSDEVISLEIKNGNRTGFYKCEKVEE